MELCLPFTFNNPFRAGMILAPCFFLPYGLHAAQDTIRMEEYSSYQIQQQSTPHGVIDPYTGEYIPPESFMESDYSAPRMSYQRAISTKAEQPGLTYQLTKAVSFNVDPLTHRLDSDIRLAGDDKHSFKMKLNTRQFRIMYLWKF